jgi:hypothetical protein
MSNITYYDIISGEIKGNFFNIDIETYPDLPTNFINGIYNGDDYYIVSGVPILKTIINPPANRFLKSGNIDTFTISVPNPTLVGVISITDNKAVSEFIGYSETVTDGSFTLGSSLSGNYTVSILPTDFSYKRMKFDIEVIDDHAVMTTEYNWNLNNPTLRAAVKYDNINLPYVMNLNVPVVNARRQVTVSSPISYTMTLNVPVVNASRDVVIDTISNAMTLNVPVVNAAHRILPDETTFEMSLNVPSIMVYEPINLTITPDALTSTFTLLEPTLNARVDEPITVISSTMTLNVPTITVI